MSKNRLKDITLNFMQDEKFMKLAIKGANEVAADGKPPIHSIMVKGGEIVARGWSSVGDDLDPSGHNDINCIKAACKKLNSLDLAECTMYTTIEPCSMCIGCAAWAGLPRIVFGAYQEDISENPYANTKYHAERLARQMRLVGGRKMKAVGGVLREECKKLMSNYSKWSPVG